MRLKRRKNNVNHDFRNCTFIPELSAKIERLRLMTNKLLDVIWSRTSSLTIESILCLRQNRR